MKGFMVFLMLAMLIASAVTTLSAIPDEEESFFNEENNTDAKDETKNQFGKSTSLRSRFLAYGKCGTKCNYSEICCEGSSTSRFLASQCSPGRGGCDQNPLACKATEGSAGTCVDLTYPTVVLVGRDASAQRYAATLIVYESNVSQSKLWQVLQPLQERHFL
ncbi:unnamed protein product [Prunus brigantina]